MRTVRTLLQISLAFAFAYAGISSLLNPSIWIGFIPAFVERIVSLDTALILISIGEIALAILFFVPRTTRITGILGAGALLGIVLFNLGQIDIVFRDISLAGAALALAFLPTAHKKATSMSTDTLDDSSESIPYTI